MSVICLMNEQNATNTLATSVNLAQEKEKHENYNRKAEQEIQELIDRLRTELDDKSASFKQMLSSVENDTSLRFCSFHHRALKTQNTRSSLDQVQEDNGLPIVQVGSSPLSTTLPIMQDGTSPLSERRVGSSRCSINSEKEE